jgi:transposase-like protein
MPATQPIPQFPNLLMQPTCPSCSSAMVLRQINPDKPGFERRIFNCPVCREQDTGVFEIL